MNIPINEQIFSPLKHKISLQSQRISSKINEKNILKPQQQLTHDEYPNIQDFDKGHSASKYLKDHWKKKQINKINSNQLNMKNQMQTKRNELINNPFNFKPYNEISLNKEIEIKTNSNEAVEKHFKKFKQKQLTMPVEKSNNNQSFKNNQGKQFDRQKDKQIQLMKKKLQKTQKAVCLQQNFIENLQKIIEIKDTQIEKLKLTSLHHKKKQIQAEKKQQNAKKIKLQAEINQIVAERNQIVAERNQQYAEQKLQQANEKYQQAEKKYQQSEKKYTQVQKKYIQAENKILRIVCCINNNKNESCQSLIAEISKSLNI